MSALSATKPRRTLTGNACAVPEPRRRGRPPLPADNETRERLLEAAQRLFAERSFTQVSVREITEAAGQSLGAMNYHFGSKDGLLAALLLRAAPALIDERLRLLREAESLHGTEARLRAILRALLMPVIRWSRQPETQRYYLPFLNRMRLDGPPELRERITSDAAHLQPFLQALARALPGLPQAEIAWRLYFVLGIEHAIHSEPQRLHAMLGDAALPDDAEEIVRRVLDFVVPGWLAAAGTARPA